MMEPRQDKQLDTPSEANTEKHVNSLDVEETSGNNRLADQTKEDKDRRKEGEQGLEEGRKGVTKKTPHEFT